jgi:hypothetical protein
VDTDIAPAVSPRDQRNSSTSGSRKTEKEKKSPYATASVSQTTPMVVRGEMARKI